MDYSLSDILNFAVVAALLVMSPGPNGVLIAKTVSRSGKVAGVANMVGFVCAFYLHGVLSIFGISLLLTQSQNIFLVVKLAGALYLCYLGITTLNEIRKPIADAAAQAAAGYQKRILVAAFSEGFLTNTLNPKVSMFYLAAFPQFIPAGGGGLSAFVLVVVHSAINAVWFSLMIFFFGYFNSANNPFFQRLMQGITGTTLLGFGVVLASTTFV